MAAKKRKKITTISMISTHGYFDPVPVLGKTDTGGQVIYILQLAKGLSKLKVKVDIYTRWFDQSQKQVERVPGYPGIRVIRISAGPWEFLPKEEIYDVLPELSQNMVGFIKNKGLNYDVFHGHYVDGGIVTLDVADALGKPAFYTTHSLGAWKRERMGGDPEDMERAFKFNHRISEELRIFKSVRGQTVTTALQREKLKDLYKFESDNVVVIPPCINIDNYCPIYPETANAGAKIDVPGKYVYCMSRIDTNKGLDLLLHAFAVVSKAMPDVHLIIGGGSNEPEERELEVRTMMNAIIAEKGLGDRVHMIGYVPDELVIPYYQNAELFVLPSTFEPFGITALEAMSCGKPVIASKLGGIRENIIPGKSGLLVDTTNTTELADAMIYLLKNPRQASTMGQESRKFVCGTFSSEAIAQRHIEFYEKFMDA